MIELVNEDDQYEITHTSGAKFTLRHWTRGMQDEVDARCLKTDGKGGYSFDVPLEREIKIEKCLADWEGVISKGEAVPCTSENKKKLPVGVFLWIIQQIDERAGIRMSGEEKKN